MELTSEMPDDKYPLKHKVKVHRSVEIDYDAKTKKFFFEIDGRPYKLILSPKDIEQITELLGS